MKTLLAVILLSVSLNANAVTAMLINCRSTFSMTGQLVYVGTYNAYGHIFTQVFPYICPPFIEVY